METNDPKLKHAMARLLPEKIVEVAGDLYWRMPNNGPSQRKILETEWLYVMQLVEEALTPADRMAFAQTLYDETNNCMLDYSSVYYDGDSPSIDCDILFTSIHATFNQRATAMCKVKGINQLTK